MRQFDFAVAFFGTLNAAQAKCVQLKPVEAFFLHDGTNNDRWRSNGYPLVFASHVAKLQEEFSDLRIGIAHFGDIPRAHLQDDYCYRSLVNLTKDFGAVDEAVKKVNDRPWDGGNAGENQLTAMAFAAGSGAGFTPYVPGDNITRLLFVYTDTWPFASGSGTYDLSWATRINCNMGGRYPLMREARDVLQASGIRPVILSTNYVSTWTNTLNSLGYAPSERGNLLWNIDSTTFFSELMKTVLDGTCDPETTTAPTTTAEEHDSSPPGEVTDGVSVPETVPTIPPTTNPPPNTEPSTITADSTEPSTTTADSTTSIVPVVVGASAGAVGLLTLGVGSAIYRGRHSVPEEIDDFEFQRGGTPEEVEEENRELENPLDSRDYGEYAER